MPRKKKQDLTVRQSQILTYIRKFNARNGYPPTRAEICDHFGFKSKKAAVDHLAAIERKGWIEITPKLSRGIKIK